MKIIGTETEASRTRFGTTTGVTNAINRARCMTLGAYFFYFRP